MGTVKWLQHLSLSLSLCDILSRDEHEHGARSVLISLEAALLGLDLGDYAEIYVFVEIIYRFSHWFRSLILMFKGIYIF